MLSLIPKFSPWPTQRPLAQSYPVLDKKGELTQLPWGLSGTIAQLSRLVFNPLTQKLQVPVLTAARTEAVATYELSGDVLTQTVPFSNMGTSGVTRVGAPNALSECVIAANGNRPVVLTWGSSSVPSGIAVGMLPETSNVLQGFASYPASIVSASTNMNLQASIHMDPTGSYGLVQYIDGLDSTRYLKYRKVRYDQAQDKLIAGTAAQEFVGQRFPIPSKYLRENQFVVAGVASTGHTYLQVLDVSGDTPVVIAAGATQTASGLAWYKSTLEVLDDRIFVTYVTATGSVVIETFTYDGVKLVRVDSKTVSGFASNSLVRETAILGDTIFTLVWTGASALDLLKVTVRNGKVVRSAIDRAVITPDATYTGIYMVKISNTRIMLARNSTNGAQYSFLDYKWTADLSSSKIVALYRFAGEEPINDATDRYVALAGAATTANEALNTNTSAASTFVDDAIYFDAGEDFTIEGRVNIASLGSSGSMLVGIWTAGGQFGNSWTLSITNARLIQLLYSTNGTTYTIVLSTDAMKLNTDHHIAAYRKAGVLRLAIDGVVQPNTAVENGASARLAKSLTTRWVDNNGWLNGRRTNIRITKEALYGAENFVPPAVIPEPVRLVYTQEEANSIVLQLGLRQESLQDEASDECLSLVGGTTMTAGRIRTTNATASYFTIPSRKFGEGDFTIEMKVNIQAVSATYGSVLLGNYRAGGVASDENRWALFLTNGRKFAFNMAISSAANDFVSVVGSTTLDLNIDYHLVAERVDGVLTLYVDGEVVATSVECDFPIRGDADWKVHSASLQNAYTVGMTCYNLRIADRAMYRGLVKAPIVFPKLPAKEYVIINGSDLASGWTLVGNAAITPEGVSIPGNSYVSGASDPKYVFWNGDFTIDTTFTIRGTIQGTGAGASAAVTTLLCWHTWGAAGQPMNYEFIINTTSGQISFSTSYSDTSLNRVADIPFTIGTKLNAKVVRKGNILYLFADGRLLFQSTYPNNIGYDTAQPIFIGRRRGGGDGSVNWYSNMLVEKLVIHKEAKM